MRRKDTMMQESQVAKAQLAAIEVAHAFDKISDVLQPSREVSELYPVLMNAAAQLVMFATSLKNLTAKL